jgi:hypothetical protein
MDYKETLEKEKRRIGVLLELESGITIKKIDGKYYKYRQVRIKDKVRSEYIGTADEEQIGLRQRLRIVEWLLRNQREFIDGVKILQELKGV